MESSSNFDKLLMWTCTNKQYFAIVYRASYLIALAIPIYIPTHFSCLLETKDVAS